ncbi:MAG: V-type ATP synthase subunit I [Clostridia bacterium]|nr:V-type ATP synthase subunit I [Clostridia bacterium]
MQKIEIIALYEDSKKIIERLQRRSAIELHKVSDDNLTEYNTSYFVSLFEKDRTKIEQALEIVNTASPEKVGLLDSFRGKRVIEKHDFGKRAAQYEFIKSKAEEVLSLNKKVNDLSVRSTKCELSIDVLSNWLSLDVPTDFAGTKYTSSFIGSIPEIKTADEINGLLPEGAFCEVVNTTKQATNIAVLFLNEKREEVQDVLTGLGFSGATEQTSVTPLEKTKQLKQEIEDNKKEIENCSHKIRDNAKYCRDFEFMIDYLFAREEKYDQISKLAMTKETVIIRGFIPEKYVFPLTKELESRFKVAISVSEPTDEDDVPVLLSNSKFSEPVEGITEMYALPGKNDIDPTPVMSFFYYLFFGMMLSDAGYGVLMVIFTAIALKKFNLEAKMRKTLKMFFYCGISTVFWGALFGSWFGDIIQVVAREFFGKTIVSTALWYQPLDNPIKLLLFSFGLGICHLFLGLGANFYNLWRQGKKWDAVCEVVPVYITITGVAPVAAGILTEVPATLSKIGGYMALVGVVLVVLTAGRTSKSFVMRIFGGLYGLYNMATGYLSDILSYSRLLALGLATGSIAGVINLIGTMPSNPVLKAILLVVVFVIGHTANLGINLLGAYVHTDRLQFVELFSKFYEGGGREFVPFGIKTKYIKLKEENSNE